MIRITVILLFLSSFNLFSQTSFNSESFQVKLADIETNTFEKDSTANAIVIYEYGNSYVDKNEYDLRTEEKHKIKILNKEGFNNATVAIYLYKSKSYSEKVEDIKGTTYNKIDGTVVKTPLNKKDIFKENYNENFDIVKFTLPNVKEGSVITYSYKTISKYMFKYHGWEFQGKIPKLYSEYNASIPGNWLYHIKLVGGKKLAINESKLEKQCLKMSNGASADCGKSKYAMKDIPAFIEEDYMTSEDNYLARIEYELETFKGMDGTIKHYTKTWETVDKEFRTDKEIGKQLKKKIDIEELLSPDIINEKENLKRAKAIYQFVQENYTWNEEFRIFKDVSVKDLIKNKSGNVSSINILLHNLLRESNIDVKPVLLSTRRNGFPTKIFPVLSDFNYLIVQVTVNGETFLLDATDKYLSFGEVPFRCLNQTGRLLDFNTSSEWIDIIPNNSNVFYNAEISIDENENISGTIQSRRTGYHAYDHRKFYFKNKSNYLDRLENNSVDLVVSDFKTSNSTSTSSTFEEQYNIEYTAEETGENIYVNPFFVKFFKENPFKLQERTYPIDFGYKDSYNYTLKLNLGDFYEVVEKPKPVIGSLPNKAGRLFFSSTIMGNQLSLTFRIEFKEAIYAPEYYPYLKKFMNKIVNIQNNSLVLLKKK
ncbi:DUF3857 domain-containing protein [Seonamhaeicola maritimus]|uniref:DUF3857 domain-containing protein n=1 Tax=Seonamhaeicola maritimus TaxID=2591822 RepID=A0A5C7GLZ5_9FLAO|nr:DUF3857 domain-containing protein [Seonamhaeicola maritimus]TXG39308.1 DUF3857 domain-containing protein [Seonamhaeicola maritimus]